MTAKLNSKSRQPGDTVDVTNEDSDSIDQYLREVGRYALLTIDEENALGARSRAGDENAIEELVNRNLRFVISVAKKYQNRGLPLGDLIGEGNIGLLTAARKFDPARGARFISYAVWWIRQAILSAVARQTSVVRVPSNRAGAHAVRDVSFDQPFGDDAEQTLLDRWSAEDSADSRDEETNALISDRLATALSLLPERNALILRLHFGIEGGREHTLEEIGALLGVTRERVRQLRDRALRRIRDGAMANELADLVGVTTGPVRPDDRTARVRYSLTDLRRPPDRRAASRTASYPAGHVGPAFPISQRIAARSR